MLYRHGGTSVSLFLFEAGKGLREHRTSGTVLIQALAGHLTIHADGRAHDLPAGRLLVMSPRVPHDVTAVVSSQMLLTVSLSDS
jgi:quercetin dioxygenase-like cupin family protein